MDQVTVWECSSCGGRGNAEDAVRHVVTCPDPSELQPLTFPLGGGTSGPLFNPPQG